MIKYRSIGWAGLCLCWVAGFAAAQTPDAEIRESTHAAIREAAAAAAREMMGPAGRDDPFAALNAAPNAAFPTRAVESNEPPPDLYLETVILRFLDAGTIQTVLQQMRTVHGAISINKANNSVVLCDTRENLDKMIAEIKKADRTPQQVMVEVVLLDVQLADDSEVGINWDLLSNERYNFGYRQSLSSSRLYSTPEVSTGTSNVTENTVGAATAFNTVGTGGDISVIFGTVRNVLHLVQEKRNVNILADPKMLVISGKSATIDAVEQIPYQEVSDTSGGGSMTSTKFKDVGVKLEVSVTAVTDDNDIFLTVSSEQSVKTGTSADGVPVVDTRKTNTSLLLHDSQTVVIGGLRREQKTLQVNQIPLLGDLPLIGFLFKSTTETKTKSELVVLLSPRLTGGGLVPEAVAARYKDINREDWLSGDAKDGKASQDSPPPSDRESGLE